MDLVRAIERLGTPEALAALRAASGVGHDAERARARAAADRLAAQGMPEPPWAVGIGAARPVAAALQFEEAFDDGVAVIVEFERAGHEAHTLGIYIDHNMGGLVKDVFIAGALRDVRAQLSQHAHNGVRLEVRDLDLDEARARVVAALDVLDHTYDPPVDEDVWRLRALVDARADLLPRGFVLDDDWVEFSDEDRDRLLADFLASPHGERWRGHEDAEDVVATAIEFGADDNHGGPLRWSPVVVEIFMVGWLARKVIRGPEFFALVPDVLPDWVAYAGRRRNVPSEAIREAVAAAGEYADDMLEAASNPDAWGPAKVLAAAAQGEGVDLSDPDALSGCADRYNQESFAP
jgi:hypothetical protein